MDSSTKVSLNKHLKSITQEKIFECSVSAGIVFSWASLHY